MTIKVYSSDPNAKIIITVLVHAAASGQVGELYVNAVSPTSMEQVLLVTNKLDFTTPDGGSPIFKTLGIRGSDLRGSVLVNNGVTFPSFELGADAGEFRLPSNTLVNVRGQLSASLPGIAMGETGQQFNPVYGTAYGGKLIPAETVSTVRLKSATNTGSNQPSDFVEPNGQTPKVLFWEPENLTTSEKLVNVLDHLEDSRIDVNLPSNGTVVGNDFVWNGGYGLNPHLTAVDTKAESHRATLDFDAGIAFAFSAATLVACLQERRQKRRTRSRALDEAPASADSALQVESATSESPNSGT